MTFPGPMCAKGLDTKARSSPSFTTILLFFLVATLAFLFFFESARELIGTLYYFLLTSMNIGGSALAIASFLSPIAYLIGFGKLTTQRVLIVTGILLAIVRLFMSFNPQVEMYLFFCIVSVILFGLFLPAMLAQYRASFATAEGHIDPYVPLGIVSAVVAGGGLDFIFRAIGDTFDITVYGFTANRLTALAIVIPLVCIFIVSIILWSGRVPQEEGRNRSTKGQDRDREGDPVALQRPFRGFYGIGIGGLGFLFLYILGYPNNISRWIGGSYIPTLIISGIALAGFILVMLIPALRDFLTGEKGLLLGNALFLVAFIFLTVIPVATVAIILCSLTFFFIPAQLGLYFRYLIRPGVEVKHLGKFFTFSVIVFILLLILSILAVVGPQVGVTFLTDQIGTILLVGVLLHIITTEFFRRALAPGHREWVNAIAPGRAEKLPRNTVISSVLVAVIIIAGTIGGFAAYPDTYVDEPELSPSRPLRVMSYNIHQGFDTQGEIDMWEVLEPIKEVDPDIISLQESDGNRITSTNVDMVQWLAHKLNMYAYFGPEGSQQVVGVSLLSKYPMTNTETYALTSLELPRVLVRGDVTINGQDVSIYAIHTGLILEDRVEQCLEIVDILNSNPKPKIMMGDFNTKPYEGQYDIINNSGLIDVWLEVNPAATPNNTFLFSMNLTQKEYITLGAVSTELRAHFSNINITLSPEAKVVLEEEHEEQAVEIFLKFENGEYLTRRFWKLRDGDKLYRIEDTAEQLEVFNETYEKTYGYTYGYTPETDIPYERIDYIWRTQDFGTRTIKSEVMYGSYGSDHIPLWAEIEW